MGSDSDGDNLHEEHSKPLEQETSLQSQHTDNSDESDALEHDVKVCDICGDAGREDLLAICCRCPDGAEHTYCMKVMRDKVPEGDWLCEECELEETKIRNRRRNSRETSAENDQSSDSARVKKSGKRHAEELETSSSFKKRALNIPGSTKDVDRGKLKPSHHYHSDSHSGNESTEGSRSPATRPRLQSLQGGFSKSSSFSFPNAKSKTKLVDEMVHKRPKSAEELSSHDTIAAKEMSKSMSFRSANLGRFGPSGSKVKMLSPNSSHVQDLRSLINKKERGFERTNSVKLNSSNSAALTPKGDKLLSSRGETNSVPSCSNSEAKPSKVDSKITSGLKANSRSVNIGQTDKQLPSSPTKVGTALSSSGTINSVEHKSIDSSSKVTSKDSTNLADGTKENTAGLNPSPSGVPCQNNKQSSHSAQGSLGNNASTIKISKDVKNGENKLKDAINAALLKKPGIYRKNKVSDQPNESSVPAVNNEASVVDRVPPSRNAGSLTAAEVSSNDGHGQISRTSSDHSKQSNGNSYKPSMLLPADMTLSSHLKNQAIPDHECIWQGSFEINRSGKTAEFWDGLQAHLSTCASPRVLEAVNKFPHKILLNGVSRVSAWPTQFESRGVKEDNIAVYFFAKDLESYEKSYLVLLDEMIKSDLALIGSINGVELLIFPSNQLPEKNNRWNMLFFLWGVFRGKKKNSSRQIPNNTGKSCLPQSVSLISHNKISSPEKSCAPQAVSSILTDKILPPEESCAPQAVSSTSTDKISPPQKSGAPQAVSSISTDKISSPGKSGAPLAVSSISTDKISSPEKSGAPQAVSSISTDKTSSPEKSCAPQAVSSIVTSKISSPEKSCAAQAVSSISTDKISLAEDATLIESIEKNKNVDSESKVYSKLQNPSHEEPTSSINVVPTSSKAIISESHMQNEPKKRPFIDLTEDVDVDSTSQINTWRDMSGRMVEKDENSNKKQKSDSYGQNNNLDIEKTDAGNSNGERYFFPVERGKTQQKPVFALDLNEDITHLVAENDYIILDKNVDDDMASSLSLSLAFSPPDKNNRDDNGMGKWQ